MCSATFISLHLFRVHVGFIIDFSIASRESRNYWGCDGSKKVAFK